MRKLDDSADSWVAAVWRRDFSTFEELVEMYGPRLISRAIVRKNEKFFVTLKRRRNVVVTKTDDGVAWRVEASEP